MARCSGRLTLPALISSGRYARRQCSANRASSGATTVEVVDRRPNGLAPNGGLLAGQSSEQVALGHRGGGLPPTRRVELEWTRGRPGEAPPARSRRGSESPCTDSPVG